MKVLPSRILILVLFVLVSCIGSGVVAEDIYVNNACSTAGNGRGTTCASSQGSAGPYNDLQVALNDNALAAGDTIHVMAGNGRYVSTADNGDRVGAGGFHLTGKSGTSAAWITIRGYQSERPVISAFNAGEFGRSYSCSEGSGSNGSCRNDSECGGVCIGNNPAFSLDGGTEYVKLQGLNVEGGLFTLGGNVVGGRGPLELDNMDIRYGFGDFSGGGNWSGVYVREMDRLHIHHSRIHDIQTFGDNLTDAAIGLFYVNNAIIENNTIGPVRGSSTTGNKNAGVNDKICNPNLTVRHNHMVDVNAAMIVSGASNACNGPSGSIQNGGGRWYGNLVECRNQSDYGGTVVLGGSHVDGEIYNNTFDQCRVGVQWSDGVTPFTMKVYNNIFSRTFGNNFGSATPRSPGYSDDLWDYNVYTSGAGYGPDGSLSARQSARGVDAGSTDQACSFVNLAGGDYHLTPGSTCTSLGHEGGVSSGATVQVGAFGAGVDCVGDNCSGGGGGNSDPIGNVEGVPNRTDTK